MNQTVIPGATYGEYWPDGTGRDSTSLPPGYLDDVLLFTRVARDGRIGGKGHNSQSIWYWGDAGWMILISAPSPNAPIAFHPTSGDIYVALGDGVHVFNRIGLLVRVISGYVGSQGIRNVNPDGSVVTGDATYGDGIVSEYTDCGDVRIGQGHDTGGIVAIVDGTPRQVLTGAQQMVRVNRVGDNFAIYGTDFRNGYRILCSRVELASLPPLVQSTPVPTPPSTAPSPTIPQQPLPPSQPTPSPAPSALPAPIVPPKGPTVIHVETPIGTVSGDKVQNDDATVSVKEANGKGYLSFDSGGTFHFAGAINSDEKFHVATSGDALVAINTFSGVKTAILPFRETA